MIKQEFCGGLIPQCPVCDSGVQPLHIDEHAREIDGIFFHGSCARFASFVEQVQAREEKVALRIKEALFMHTLPVDIF